MMSDTEPGEYKRDNHSPPRRSRSRSKHSGSNSDSSHSRVSVGIRRSYSRSRSRSRSYRSRSRSRSYRRRYHSRSPDKYAKNGRHGYSRSRSRSYSRERQRGSRSPMSSRKRHIGDRLDPPRSRCLGIFGLSLYTTESDLRSVFSRYGRIEDVNIVIDQKTGRSRGFSFVYFESPDDAEEAKERANGMELDGRRIRVDYSITKRPHTPTPGVYVGRPPPPREERGYDRYEPRERYRDDYRRDNYRRSPSPYHRRRSPSPHYRDRSPYRSSRY
ncbi:transformer-2 protein homolog beta-like isoform X2 [Clavelina lepadiformis]|uniref:RRM domain-containing protein n=1 Tax=Clavelina lepadiformis TaxID=159417 RepID=A0ABP0GF61_CLALP